MHHTDYVLIVNRSTRARRIHRATCKRASAGTALADTNQADLAGATPAGCCKPNPEQVAGALLALTAERDRAEEDTLVPYSGSGLAKHYWPVVCRRGGLTLAEALGVRGRGTAGALLLVGQLDNVVDARDIITSTWQTIAEEFQTWRTTDEEYLAIRAADKGIPWGKSGKRVAELDWLAARVERAVEEVRS